MNTQKITAVTDRTLQRATGSTLQLDGPATWQTVKHWADLSAKFQHASVAAQVMAGFGLLELRKQHFAQGKRPDDNLAESFGEVGAGWQKHVKEEVGISDDTARNWMKMAEGIKAKWKKLAPQERLKELMAVSPNEWNDADVKLVSESLHKVTDGQTQLEFMRDLGLAKKPPGNKEAHGQGKRRLTTAEQAAQLRQFALEDAGSWGAALKSSNANFMLLLDVNDLEVSAQVAALEFALKVRLKVLNTPRAKRTEALFEEVAEMVRKENSALL